MPITYMMMPLNPSQHLVSLIALLLLSFFALTATSSYAAESGSVGTVSFTRGTVAATNAGLEARLLGKDAAVFEGDNIQTSERSFVIIAFMDGTKITIRPNSNFTVSQFSNEDGKKTAKLALHKGGIRASSGDIADSSPDDFQITTPTTTIKAQQADYSVRVCEGAQCQQEDDKLKKGAITPAHDVIARVVEIKGDVSASGGDISQDARPLTLGAPLYSADVLKSEANGFAVVVFKDKGRITLQEDASFAISEYHLNETGTQDKAFFKLIEGGMRVLTGSIGKENNDDYEVDTLVATIGIRGTGFDLVQQDTGLSSKVWLGTIAQTNEAGTTEITAVTSNHIKDKFSKPTPIKDDDSAFATAAPRPDLVKVPNEPELFKTMPLDLSKPGTYVDVHDGHVRVQGSDGVYLDLGKNESSYTNDAGMSVRLETPPKFMAQDPYPLPSEGFSENLAELGTYSLLNEDYALTASGQVFQCECAQ